MKKLTPLLLISVLFLSACSATYHGSALYDDVYYGSTEVAPVNNVVYERPEYIDTDYEYEGEEYIEDRNTQDSLRSDYNAPAHFGEANYYEYMNDEPYEMRLLRFHGPLWRYRYAYSYYDPYYMYDQYDYFGTNNFIYMGWPYNYRNRLYVGSPLAYLFDWSLNIGFGFNFNFGYGSNFGWGYPFGGYGYGNYGGFYGGYYGGYGGYYGGYGGYYGHYGGAYQGYYPSTREVQYGQRNTRGQINSRNVIQTPREARGYTSRTKDANTGTRSIRGSRTTQTEQRGSSGLVGNLQHDNAKTTPKRTRSSITNSNNSRGSYSKLNRSDQSIQRDARSSQNTRSITNNRLAKTANSNSREQQINNIRQRYTRTSPKYNKPGSYTSPDSRTATSSRQYTSPQRNARSLKYSTQTRSTNQSLRKVTNSATRTQRYSTPSRSIRNVKSSPSRSFKSGASRSSSKSYTRSGSGSVRSSSGSSSSSGSGSKSSGSRGKR